MREFYNDLQAAARLVFAALDWVSLASLGGVGVLSIAIALFALRLLERARGQMVAVRTLDGYVPPNATVYNNCKQGWRGREGEALVRGHFCLPRRWTKAFGSTPRIGIVFPNGRFAEHRLEVLDSGEYAPVQLEFKLEDLR